jgi:predicted restriction endonuclease
MPRHASFVTRQRWTGRPDAQTQGGRDERTARESVAAEGTDRERERVCGCGKIRRRREGRWVKKKKKHLSAHSYNNNIIMVILLCKFHRARNTGSTGIGTRKTLMLL